MLPSDDDWPLVDPFGGRGRLILSTPWKRVWLSIDASTQQAVQCTEERVDPLMDINAEVIGAAEGKRWGDGQRVASMPLGWYWRNIMPARLAGDEKHIKKILNDSDYSKFRTFPGRI